MQINKHNNKSLLIWKADPSKLHCEKFTWTNKQNGQLTANLKHTPSKTNQNTLKQVYSQDR